MILLGKFRDWLRDNFGAAPQKRERKGQRVRPGVESLEQREVPATFNVANVAQLQAAVAAASASAAADVINVAAGNYVLTNELVVTGGGALTIRNLTGVATITDDLGDNRILRINAGANVTLSRLTITGGVADNDHSFGAQGGGILNFGTLSVLNCTITKNHAIGDGAESGPSSAIGGGIASFGQLTITGSTISSNSAEAGDDTAFVLFDNDFSSGFFAEGGGVAHYQGKLSVTNTKFLNNEALGGDTLFTGGEGDAAAGLAEGGGLFAGAEGNLVPSITITGSTFTNNHAIGGDIEDISNDGEFTFVAAGEGIGGGASLGGFFNFGAATNITVTNTTFTNNRAEGGEALNQGLGDSGEVFGGEGFGGGLFTNHGGAANVKTTLTTLTFTNNQALGGDATNDADSNGFGALGGEGSGGGVFVRSDSFPKAPVLVISNSTFSKNKAEGGDAETSSDFDDAFGGEGYGGGLQVFGGEGVTLTNNKFTDNQALGGAAEASGFFADANGGEGFGGGAAFGAEGFAAFFGSLTVTSNTFATNTARGGAADSSGGEGSDAFGGEGAGGGLGISQFVGTTTITSSTFTDNHALGGNGTAESDTNFNFALGGEGLGGGIFYGGITNFGGEGDDVPPNLNFLKITNSTLTSNDALGGKGEATVAFEVDNFSQEADASGGWGVGGGLFIGGEGAATITTTKFTSNTATGGTAEISGGEGSDAFAGAGIGGGISALAFSGGEGLDFIGTLNITSDTFASNIAQGGSATANDADDADDFDDLTAFGGEGQGGGLAVGFVFGSDDEGETDQTVTVSASTFSANQALGGDATMGGEGFAQAGNGEGGGVAQLSGSQLPRLSLVGISPFRESLLTITTTTLTGNIAQGGNVTSVGSASNFDIAIGGEGVGGGLFVESGEFTFTSISRNTLDHNQALGGAATGEDEVEVVLGGHGLGGGLGTGGFGAGGAVENNVDHLIITNTTFTLNDALGGDGTGGNGSGGEGGDGLGGGLFLVGDLYTRIVNSTIARNDATGGIGDFFNGEGSGGGIFTENSKPSIAQDGGSDIDLLNTLIALNTAFDFGPDVFGAFHSLGNNLIGDPTDSSFEFDAQPTDILNVDPKLGQLANNGGPTQTLALLAGSAAINKGSNSVLFPNLPDSLTVDQRGFVRRQGPAVDIGAYEFGSALLGRGQP